MMQYFNDWYCKTCQEIVGSQPISHREKEHDGSFDVGLMRIDGQSDDQPVATPDDCGHFTPHSFAEVDGQQVCQDCGAVRLSDDVLEEYDS